MPAPAVYTIESSGAFVEAFAIEPTSAGPLDGLTFAVKDLFDVAGRVTGCGNPTWQKTHPPATAHAVAVEQLLAAGARCIGKTISDELAFSLVGENFFFGTPLNPKAPDRVPGGSSSGSASAVACGLADFALGTDTGGSVRVPASNCGIWGMRPSHGLVSVAGVMPFAPGFDTVGVLARSGDILAKAMKVLLGLPEEKSLPSVETVYLAREAKQLVVDECREAMDQAIDRLKTAIRAPFVEISLGDLCGDADAADPMLWHDVFCQTQWAEIESSLGAWVADAQPQFGPATAANFALTKNLNRPRATAAIAQREALFRGMQSALGHNRLLCLPTVPSPAPLKGSNAHNRSGEYYRRALSLTAISGLCRLPQISMPLAEIDGAPMGLSVLGPFSGDALALMAACMVAA